MEIYGGKGTEVGFFLGYFYVIWLVTMGTHSFCDLKGKANKLLFLKINRHVNKFWKMDINDANVKLSQNYQM